MNILDKLTDVVGKDNRIKVAVLTIVIILCFGLIFATGNSAPSRQIVQSTAKNYTNTAGDDFASVLSNIEGAGEVSLFVTYMDADNTQVMGVIIVAEGASNLDVVLKLQSAAATAYGISIDQIEVFEMKGVNTQ